MAKPFSRSSASQSPTVSDAGEKAGAPGLGEIEDLEAGGRVTITDLFTKCHIPTPGLQGLCARPSDLESETSPGGTGIRGEAPDGDPLPFQDPADEPGVVDGARIVAVDA